MGPYITDAELKDSVASALGVYPSSDLSAEWDSIISAANKSAANDIVQALMALSYSISDIENWDQIQDFNRDLGTFWSLTRGSGLGNYPAQQLESLDRRDELRKLTLIMVSGVGVAAPAPNTSAVGGISSGHSTAGRQAGWHYDREINGRLGYPVRQSGPGNTLWPGSGQ